MNTELILKQPSTPAGSELLRAKAPLESLIEIYRTFGLSSVDARQAASADLLCLFALEIGLF